MSRRAQNLKFESIGSDLIKHILGFEEGDENFKRSLSYVLSNLLYHHCLDVNSHSIKRSIVEVGQKMTIHGHREREEKLSRYVEKFLNLPILGDKGDLKWSLLSLLLLLSQNPAGDEIFTSSPESIEPSLQEEEDFADIFSEIQLADVGAQKGDETLSDWSDVEEESAEMSECGKGMSDNLDQSVLSVSPNEQSSFLPKDYRVAQEWLNNNLQECYWNKVKGKSLPMSEYAAIRESLWLLMHPSSGYLYIEDGGTFLLKEDVTIATLSREALLNLTLPICTGATQLKKMADWLSKVSGVKVEDSNYLFTSGLLIAYAESLRKWQRDFLKILGGVEKGSIKQECTITLYSVISTLRPYLITLSGLYNVHTKSFCDEDDEEWKSLRILSHLFEMSSSSCSPMLRSALHLVIGGVLRHIAQVFGSLLNGGCPKGDSLREFGLQRSADVIEGEAAFCCYCIAPNYPKNLRGIRFLTALHKYLIDICNLTKMFNVLKSPVLQDDINIESVIFDCLCKKIHKEDVLSNLQSELKECENIFKKSNTEENLKPVVKESGLISPSFKVLCDDPLLEMAFRKKKSSKSFVQKNISENVEIESMAIDCQLMNALVPIFEERVLKMGLRLQSIIISDFNLGVHLQAFVDIMLLEAGDVMRMFLLTLFSKIDNRDELSEVDLTLHLRYCISQTWPNLADDFSINLEEFESKIKDQRSKSDVCEGKVSFPPDLLSTILIDFKVRWPVSLVLNKSNISLYNNLFRFCLSLKKGMIALEKLNFKEIGAYDSCYSENCEPSHDSSLECKELDGSKNMPLPYLIHRLHLLRQWQLHLAKLLHDHFATSLLHPFTRKIAELIKTEMTFEQFVHAHHELLSKLCVQCLLSGGKTSPIQIALAKVFLSIESLSKIWRGPPSNIVLKKIEDLEDEFSSCHRFLARFLTSLEQNSLCPYIEALAQALVHSCPV